MEKIKDLLYIILMLLPLLITACIDDFKETDIENQPLELSVNEEMLNLDVTAPKSSILTFEWTSGSNYNTNRAINYLFELALDGVNFENSIKTELNQGKNSVTYTTEELNSILLDKFDIEPGSGATIVARVTASVQHENVSPQVSEIVKVSVFTYKPVSSTLYMIGSSAPNGWSADDATMMNTVSGTAGGFVWQGKLNVGELKFITTLGEFMPGYGKGENDTKLSLIESDEDLDEKFEINATGIYRISLNIINLTIFIEALDAPEYNELWFVGNPTGWSFKPMIVDQQDPFIFYYNADLNDGGEFKIATMPDFDPGVVFLRPEVNGQGEGIDMNVVKWSENENLDDYKWNISAGVYKIKLDTRDMKIDIIPHTPFEMIYLVGEATPNGWNIGNATPMTATGDPNIFTWSGALSEGEMKFSADKKDDWNGAWFLASADGIEPAGDVESVLFSAIGSNPDNKWMIKSAGTYYIELNQLQETVIIKKQ